LTVGTEKLLACISPISVLVTRRSICQYLSTSLTQIISLLFIIGIIIIPLSCLALRTASC